MSLFVCETPNCQTVDNTAMPGQWTVKRVTGMYLCHRCRTGGWHGHFPEDKWDGERSVVNAVVLRGDFVRRDGTHTDRYVSRG